MNRRNFIYLSGSSLAACMFTSGSYGKDNPQQQLAWPAEVWIQSGDEWLQLKSTDSSAWVYKDAAVTLKHLPDTMSVSVLSPSLPLCAVKLVWPFAATAPAKYLGDHWERTYGDVSWSADQPGKKMPWYFMQYDGSSTNCFGVKTGANSICYWQVNAGSMQLIADTRSGGVGVQLNKRTLHAADIIVTKSESGETPFTTGKRFCKLMCGKPRLARLPVYGINDWYFAYGNNSYDLILQHTSLLTDLATDTNNRPFSVIDAGWAAYSPLLPGDCCWQDDFSKPNDKFKDMHKLAGAINKLGMRAGLWTRPLIARHDDKKSLLLPSIPGRDEAAKPVLDPTIDENMERIKRIMSTYREWGYEMVKHDFSTYDMLGKWGFEMTDTFTTAGWRFNDNSKTNAEIILHLYHSLREAAGSMYLIGCNTVSHLAAGLFELNRIGDDTSGNEWERTRKMGVNTLAFRSIQHNHFYAADADCVGLTTKIPWSKNKQWMQLLAQSGTPLFISAQPDALGTEQKHFIKQCFSEAATVMPVAEPLDWLDTMLPEKWKLNNQLVTFDWS